MYITIIFKTGLQLAILMNEKKQLLFCNKHFFIQFEMYYNHLKLKLNSYKTKIYTK